LYVRLVHVFSVVRGCDRVGRVAPCAMSRWYAHALGVSVTSELLCALRSGCYVVTIGFGHSDGRKLVESVCFPLEVGP
jgi:hypothetical protein